jgi:hypothetical protein
MLIAEAKQLIAQPRIKAFGIDVQNYHLHTEFCHIRAVRNPANDFLAF